MYSLTNSMTIFNVIMNNEQSSLFKHNQHTLFFACLLWYNEIINNFNIHIYTYKQNTITYYLLFDIADSHRLILM